MFLKKEKNEKKEDNDENYQKEILKELEYMNKYLATLTIAFGEVIKQDTINNALIMLNHQYQHPDSFMDIEEIKNKYYELAPEIFQDYAILKENELNNLEKNK